MNLYDTDDLFNDDVRRSISERDPSYQDASQHARVWDQIVKDDADRGPFRALRMSMKASAQAAMLELVYCEPTDQARVRSLQAEIRRHIVSEQMIEEFRQRAEAGELSYAHNSVTESDEDTPFEAQLEEAE